MGKFGLKAFSFSLKFDLVRPGSKWPITPFSALHSQGLSAGWSQSVCQSYISHGDHYFCVCHCHSLDATCLLVPCGHHQVPLIPGQTSTNQIKPVPITKLHKFCSPLLGLWHGGTRTSRSTSRMTAHTHARAHGSDLYLKSPELPRITSASNQSFHLLVLGKVEWSSRCHGCWLLWGAETGWGRSWKIMHSKGGLAKL